MITHLIREDYSVLGSALKYKIIWLWKIKTNKKYEF